MKPFAALRIGPMRPRLVSVDPRPLQLAARLTPAAFVVALSPSVFAQTPPTTSAAVQPPTPTAAPTPAPATQTPSAVPSASPAPNTAPTGSAASSNAASPPEAVPETSPPPVGAAPADVPTPPPYPAAPAAEPAPAPAPGMDIYEPPLPGRSASNATGEPAFDTPLPPPPSKHIAPRSSLWVGARPGLFVPLGAMWIDGEPIGEVCCTESVRPFSEFASTGPSLGFDLGVRFARHYQAFAFWEHAWLSSGGLEDAFGGQTKAATSMFGGGFRFSTHPDAIGMVVELSLGYRTFEAEWQSGTQLTAADDLFSTRLGFGVEWRINRFTTAELLLMVGGGAFTDVKWDFADGTSREALTGYDRYGQYIPFGIQLASHWDVISSDD